MGVTPMGERYRRPDWVRRVNAMGSASGGPRPWCPIEPEELIEQARASTGVADPGDLGDGDWEGRLRALVDAVNGSDLHVVGRLDDRGRSCCAACAPGSSSASGGAATRRSPTR